jgi:hypothetical protein
VTQPTATATPAPGPEGDTLAEELAAIPYEPLLPVEQRLIAGSLLLGVAPLGVLLWVSSTFFPIQALTK